MQGVFKEILRNLDARVDVEGIGIGGVGAVLNFEIGGGSDHRGVVARESDIREKQFQFSRPRSLEPAVAGLAHFEILVRISGHGL